MKLLPFRNPFKKQNLPVAARRPVVTAARPRGRATYDTLGFNHLLGPWFRIPADQRFELYERLREGIPILDRAIQILVELVGCPKIEAAEETEQELMEWLGSLSVNRTQVGIGCFLQTWIGDMLTYGRSHAEVIPTNRYDDIAALLSLHPSTISFRPAADGYHVETVQMLGPQPPVVFEEWRILNAVRDIRGDNPNGTSLIWGLPFVGEIWLQIYKSSGQLWERFGSPIWHANYEPPADFHDPQGSEMEEIVASLRAEVEAVMQAAANGQRRELVSGGKVTVSIMGANGEELELEQPAHLIEDQIMAKTGIPPLLLGITRATTERMSTVQAGTLAEVIDSIQEAVTPALTRFFQLRQRLKGLDDAISVKWEAANLVDQMQAAQAMVEEENARKLERENDLSDWRGGYLMPLEYARKRRPDLAHLDDAELKRRLPAMEMEPPEPQMPAPAGGAQSEQERRTGPNDNRPPQMQRSLTYNGNLKERR